MLSIARALSFNGLGNVLHVVAINGGTHANPVFAGDTIYAWSEVLDKADLPGHPDLGALRLRLVATKDRPCADFPVQGRRRQLPARGRARLRLLGHRLALSGRASGSGSSSARWRRAASPIRQPSPRAASARGVVSGMSAARRRRPLTRTLCRPSARRASPATRRGSAAPGRC